ncbi:hypothetical protein PJP08_29370, partial [Mycobacterium kansasii]
FSIKWVMPKAVEDLLWVWHGDGGCTKSKKAWLRLYIMAILWVIWGATNASCFCNFAVSLEEAIDRIKNLVSGWVLYVNAV